MTGKTPQDLAREIVAEKFTQLQLKYQMRMSKRRLASLESQFAEKARVGETYEIPDHNGELKPFKTIRRSSIRKAPKTLSREQIEALEDIGVKCEASPHYKILEAKFAELLPDIENMTQEQIRNAVGNTLFSIIKVEANLELIKDGQDEK